MESGVNTNVEDKFPGAQVKYGSAASGAGGNREIPLDEGGDLNRATGQSVSLKNPAGCTGPSVNGILMP